MIHSERRGSVTVLRIDHGPVGAIDTDLLSMLAARLDDVESAGSKAIVLTGTGSSFSAGLDLRRILDGGEPYVRELLAAVRKGFARLFTFPAPVVAAINGHAIAGGCVLAACCDHRIAADGAAKIGFPKMRVRLSYPTLAMETVRFAVPDADLERLLHGGEIYTVSGALELGLIDEVAAPEKLIEKACEAARRIEDRVEGFAAKKRRLRQPVVERSASDPALDEAVDRAWSDPELHAAIRSHLEAAAGH